MTNAEALDVMIRALNIFEKAQAEFDEKYWADMSLYMGDVKGTVTWSQVSDVKEALEDFKDTVKDIEYMLGDS
jgi:hypothetical protein